MTVLKLVGAKGFMNKRASPDVIRLGGLTEDLDDDKLIEALLANTRVDAEGNERSIFSVHEPQASEPEKKKVAKKKATRSRSRSTTDTTTN